MVTDHEKSEEIKHKGRVLQETVAQSLRDIFVDMTDLPDGDHITGRPMSAHGEDIIFSNLIRERVPVSIECKFSEKGYGKIYKDYGQAAEQAIEIANEGSLLEPIVVIKQGDEEPLVCMDLSYAIDLIYTRYIQGSPFDGLEDGVEEQTQ